MSKDKNLRPEETEKDHTEPDPINPDHAIADEPTTEAQDNDDQ